MGKAYKHHKKGAGRHVQLPEYLQATEAWASLKAGPRALYIELKRRFNGSNNGDIFLSQWDAARSLNVSRNTAAGYFDDLIARGFIRLTVGPHLGPSGIGQASKWALEELPTRDGKAFAAWRKEQKPRAKLSHPGAKTAPLPIETAPKGGRPAQKLRRIRRFHGISRLKKIGPHLHIAIGRSAE